MGTNDPLAGRDWLPFLSMAIENANDAVIVYDYDPAGPMPFRMAYVNPMFERQTGYSREEAVGRFPDILYGPQTDRAAVDRTTATLLSRLPVTAELYKYRKDGTAFWSEINMRPLSDESGALVGVVAIQRDVTERVKALRKLELLSSAMDQANDPIAIYEWRDRPGEWRIEYVNEMFLRLTGYRRDEVIGRTSDFLSGPETDAETLYGFRQSLAAGESVRGEIAYYRSDGTLFWAELNGRALREANGTISHNIIVYREVTESHGQQERLSYEATHDPLTGVNNRRSFVAMLDAALADTRQRRLVHGLLFFDLDGFKPINDRHGHEAGDRMLVALSAAICAKLRRGDVLARMGGDEFAVLLHGCPLEKAERIAGDLLSVIGDLTLLWRGHALRIGASIGVICIDEALESSDEALRRVDEACYEAKRGGRNRVIVATGTSSL
jgi:diguanylate cyclase (GGDEF)-like protein/PAS domain S-box-containing protein